MLTIRFDRLPIGPDTLFLDAGAGFGRHAYEAARRGATVVALDYGHDEVTATRNTFAAMAMTPSDSAAPFVAMQHACRLPMRHSTVWLPAKCSNTSTMTWRRCVNSSAY